MYSDLQKQGLRFKENIQAWFPQKEQEHQAERKLGVASHGKNGVAGHQYYFIILFYYFVLYFLFEI
jgi:hypothetical protein